MKRRNYIVILIFLTFFAMSFVTNILGALNPDIIKSFHLSLTMSALLPFTFFIAYGIMAVPSGIMVEKYKEKKIMFAAFLVSFLGALMFSVFPNYWIFLISLFMMGSGMAMLLAAINPLLRVAGGEENFAFNSVMAQFIFGGASFLAPMFLTYLVSNLKSGSEGNLIYIIFSKIVPQNMAWVSLYWVFAFLLFLTSVMIVGSKFPDVKRKEDEKSGSWVTYKMLFKRKNVILYFAGILAYAGAVQGVSYWISKFLYTYHNCDPLAVGSSIVGWFWGLMSIGCIVGLGLLKLFDSRKILILNGVLSLVFLALALYGSENMSLLFFPAVGFTLSVTWSIVFSLALNSVEIHHGSFNGILYTAMIGGAVIQLFIGLLGDVFGLRIGMLFIFIALAYIISIGFWAKPVTCNGSIELNKARVEAH